MSTVVISPHTDDAIFSLGAHLYTLCDDITIACPLAGIPTDAAGRDKHTTLRREHDAAARVLGAEVLNGDFLDDVYDPPPIDELTAWLHEAIDGYDNVYVPVGIHHPDHVMVSDVMIGLLAGHPRVSFYEELPYRVLYPYLLADRHNTIRTALGRYDVRVTFTTVAKDTMVRLYYSQVDEDLITKLLVPEHLWRLR